MDTRNKIKTVNDALAAAMQAKENGKRLVISYGDYDPMLAEHAERLAARRTEDAWHVVAVLPGDNAMLPLAARCEMAAALRAVDCVVAFEQSPSLLSMVAGKAELHDDRNADAEARRGLIAHIHAKQKLAGPPDGPKG
ncbi:MAG: hypothetical protein U5J83_17445 [Bryobacterales bacterium]|nr:hypothetical protein [Bryobacterales bacterium]